ncbi:hypothetical protein CP863_08400 [Cutibacterium acnes]|uniref:Uncharacterized protein n=2 Tax=Cutibacterium acnes TaxID=1747 RepID=A0AAD0VNB4_CUTAC|nr:hypothetical protein PPA0854 [Cutibacterium acnes KPA171202]AXM06291.1 hypothetical protein DXN06_03320 [Cutibacterium acnes]EFT78943.1 hypothetical protein HMPREF9601_00815 [Cutibacterium acnes HL030PA1]PGF34244.1 hypothetical protein B1B10_04760 [Cutibacterium acnes subsp. acnes]PGF35795.1 hypothetical protein B1B11_05695 [Cutibacterium acnes subsp. acnes]
MLPYAEVTSDGNHSYLADDSFICFDRHIAIRENNLFTMFVDLATDALRTERVGTFHPHSQGLSYPTLTECWRCRQNQCNYCDIVVDKMPWTHADHR